MGRWWREDQKTGSLFLIHCQYINYSILWTLSFFFFLFHFFPSVNDNSYLFQCKVKFSKPIIRIYCNEL